MISRSASYASAFIVIFVTQLLYFFKRRIVATGAGNVGFVPFFRAGRCLCLVLHFVVSERRNAFGFLLSANQAGKLFLSGGYAIGVFYDFTLAVTMLVRGRLARFVRLARRIGIAGGRLISAVVSVVVLVGLTASDYASRKQRNE